MNEKGSFQIRVRIRDQRDRGTVAGLERTDRGALRNDPHGPINWGPRTMDGLFTDVRSDVGQVDACLAQEVSQGRSLSADAQIRSTMSLYCVSTASTVTSLSGSANA